MNEMNYENSGGKSQGKMTKGMNRVGASPWLYVHWCEDKIYAFFVSIL